MTDPSRSIEDPRATSVQSVRGSSQTRLADSEGGNGVQAGWVRSACGLGDQDRTGKAIPILVAVLMFLVYVADSLNRHDRIMTAAYDLGIFDQAVRSYSHFHLPTVPIKGVGFNLLGDHFHPILATLAPFYWLWPNARMLLVAQAALIAASVAAIGRLAVVRLGKKKGAAVTVAYGMSWGIQDLIAFDFHEVAFAVPLIALAMCALAEERWRVAAAWTLPLLLVKEDLGVTVAAIGCYMSYRRQWRLGLLMIGAGLAASFLIITVVIPSLNTQHHYPYWSAVGGSQLSLARRLAALPLTLFYPVTKPLLMLALVGVTAGLALRSSLLVIALPTLIWRLASPNPLYWSTGPFHYNALLMPILFVALIDAIRRSQGSKRSWLRTAGHLAPVAALVIALGLIAVFPLRAMFNPGFYKTTTREEAARQIMREIPDGARVAASNYLAPQLTDRAQVVLFPRFTADNPVDWVVVETTHMSIVPVPPDQHEIALRALPSDGFRLVDQRAGIVLYKRG